MCHNIFNRTLNYAAHWAGAETWIIANVYHSAFSVIIDRYANLLYLEVFVDSSQNKVDDLQQFFFVQWSKDDNFIKAVQEFWKWIEKIPS